MQKTVVFLTASVTGGVLFPVCHAEAASSEAVSVLWVGGRGKIDAEAAIFYGRTGRGH